MLIDTTLHFSAPKIFLSLFPIATSVAVYTRVMALFLSLSNSFYSLSNMLDLRLSMDIIILDSGWPLLGLSLNLVLLMNFLNSSRLCLMSNNEIPF